MLLMKESMHAQGLGSYRKSPSQLCCKPKTTFSKVLKNELQ